MECRPRTRDAVSRHKKILITELAMTGSIDTCVEVDVDDEYVA
jgi:hypothetical protein